MSGKRDSFLSLPTKKWKKMLGFGLEDDEIQSKVLEATSGNQANNDLSSFSQVVQLTGSGWDKALKTLKAVYRVIISDEWYRAFKGLQLLNYLLHYGTDYVLPWVLGNLRSLEEYARNLDDYHHKQVLQEQLWDIRTLVEDNRQLDKEREDSSHNGWLIKVIRPPPPREGSGYIFPNSSLGLPNLTPTPASSAHVSPSGSLSGSTAPLSPVPPSKSTSAIWDGRWQNQGGMDNAVEFPAADNGGRSTRRDFTSDRSRETHSGSSENFKMLDVSKPTGSGTVAPTQTLLEVPREEPSLIFLTASQESVYKARFVFLADEGSHVISRERTTMAIQRLEIPTRSIAHIWQAVKDVTSSCELYFPEYALAMYLANELREGRLALDFPLRLPPTIKKNVEDRVNFIVANIVQKEEDQPDPTQLWVWKDVELGRRINEVGDQVRRALIEMTEEEEHAYISDEETSDSHTLGLSWTPGRGSSIRETCRTNDQETEISELMELQTTIKGTQGEALEVEGGTKHVEPSLAKNTWSDIALRDGNLESEAALNDPDGAVMRAVKALRVAEQKRQEEDAAKAKVKLPRDMEEDEKRVDKAAAEARQRTEAAAEERRQVEEEERRVLYAAAEAEAAEREEAQQKLEAEIQRQEEARSGYREGYDESIGEQFLDSVENLVIPREESERNIIASTSEGSQLVDIALQSERSRTSDRHEENSRIQTLTQGRETLTPSTGEGTATGTQMPQHRQMELLGHPDDRHQTPSPQLRIQRQQTPNSDLSSISSSRTIPDLVRDSKLETAFAPSGQVVRHVSYTTNPRMRRRRVRKEEIWERQSELGSGAFGRVWLEKCATGDDIGKLRAVKEITKLQRQGRSSEIDYNRELEAIAKFSHKKYVHCFVQSFGWYESKEAIFIAMEYLEHGDLQSHLDRSFPEDEVRDIVFQLLEGLSFMHENGFAHRDLKPANILVSEHSPNWWVKISDFGISKRAEEEATAFRTLVGTRGYIAPEVIGIYCPEDIATIADSSSLYTVAVDLWALGAIMFKLLTHENVFAEPLELARYVTARRPFPRALVSEKGVGEACMSFLEQAMAHSPTSRPTSSQALAHEWLADLSNQGDSSEEFPDAMSASSTGFSTGPFTPVPGESTASAAWPSTFS